jgi:type VI secretion system secreted protein VgrG
MYTTEKPLSLKLTTPLGKDKLILDHLTMVEQASAPYVITLQMHSLDPQIDFEALVGKQVTASLKYPGGTRYFGGIVGEIEQGITVPNDVLEQTYYVAKVYPQFWLLKFSQDHQIFQHMSALDIIKKVLQDNGVIDVEDKTSGAFPSREYCVQYRESYFNFVSRLMEEEGIFYSFDHQDSKTVLVLADGSQVAKVLYGSLDTTVSTNTQLLYDQVQHVALSQQVVAKKYSGADYNFQTASTKLYSKVDGDGAGQSVYRYPGRFLDMGRGDALSTLRIQELEWFKKTIKGTSTAPLLTPMGSFTVKGHPRGDLNRSYLTYKVIHTVNMLTRPDQQIYQNEFMAFPDDVPFRPPIVSPKPIIPSTQTAKVTGKPGEEIWCDKYGRIKVKFHWDQKGSDDDKSSCWIRVAQLWAGNMWGGLWTPRVGMEVVVTFLEGDPDKPLITGCVYNSDHIPMYAENEPTKSTIKSDSTKGGGGFNEFRYEDKKGDEEIYIHAEKDMNTVVEENRTLKINEKDDQTDIYCGNRMVTLHADTSQYRSNEGHDTLTLKKGNRKVELLAQGPNKGNHTLELIKGDNIIHLVKGDMTTTLDSGNKVIHLLQGNMTTMLDAGNYTVQITGNIKISATGNIDITAGGNITMTAGGNIIETAAVIKLN